MKSIFIALKDLTRSFRSLFLLAFMFFIPLLVTGMFSLMFGGTAAEPDPAVQAAPDRAKLVIADLDQGSSQFSQQLAAFAQGLDAPATLGQILVQSLQADSLAGLLEVTRAADAPSARQAVLSGQASAALLIPADFSTAYMAPQARAAVELYTDPAQPAGAAVARSVVSSTLDTFVGMKIAVGVSLAHAPLSPSGQPDPVVLGSVVQETLAWNAAAQTTSLLDLRTPSGAPQPANPLTQIIGPIMAGMLIFFAFFTAAATAQTILKEQEEGTLARLFTTPTRISTILGGKFLAVGLTVLVQVTVMLMASTLLFHIQWGALAPVALAAAGIMICATMFGIFLNSLLKDTRQGGIVFGGFLTVTGMIAMLGIFTGGGTGAIVALFVPQGWALRGLILSLNGASLGEVALNLLAVLAWSAVFLAAGLLRFNKRFA